MPWSPLARGRLTRDWDDEQRPGRDRTSSARRSMPRPPTPTGKVVEAVAKVAAARGIPRAQVALAWLLQKPGITAPIVGATKLSHLEDAAAALSVKLSDEEIAAAGGALRAARGRRLQLTRWPDPQPALL